MSENPVFSYTRRDYEGSRQEGIAKIPILSQGKWTDLNSTDPGIIILDYIHAIVDMMNYYQDHQALEAFITTAKERANIFRLAKQLSYNIRSAKGALCDVTFQIHLVYEYPIKIPKYTAVSTLSGISYLTKVDAYIPAGSTSVTVPCMQGTLSEQLYTGTGVSRFSQGIGAKNQEVLLYPNNIDTDTITVTDNLGIIWTPVDYIVFSNSKEKVYQIDLNPDNTVSIKFGDGVRGVVPNTTDKFSIKYVINSAEDGYVDPNSLIVLEDQIIDQEGKYVEVNVYNTTASVGGSSVQSSQEIRELAPGAIKAQNRAVTLKDFENLAKLVTGVRDAKAYDINTSPDLCLHHEVKVLIVPTGDRINSIDALKQSVKEFLSQRMIPPTNLQIMTPIYQDIDISVVVKKVDEQIEGGLEYDITQTIIDYFSERSGDIGEDFYPSDLSVRISSVPNVRYIVSMTPTEVVHLPDLYIARLGKVSVEVQ